jgi:hypothetical protein
MPPKKDSIVAGSAGVGRVSNTASRAEPKKPGVNSKSAAKAKSPSPSGSPSKKQAKPTVEEAVVVEQSLEEILAEARKAFEEANRLEAEKRALDEISKPPIVLQPWEIKEHYIRHFLALLVDDPEKLRVFFSDEEDTSIAIDNAVRVVDREIIVKTLRVR